MTCRLFCGTVLLPDGELANGAVLVEENRIAAVAPRDILIPQAEARDAQLVEAPPGGYIAPGFVDLHVHGGAGADFMDGTAEAFRTVLACHTRHGTTSCTPTTTVARHDQIVAVLELCRQFKAASVKAAMEGTDDEPPTARVLGAHFYGPYFHPDACGCHPSAAVRPPIEAEFETYLQYADAIVTATVAPELPGAEAFAKACKQRGIRLNAGHSLATFAQVEAALGWGLAHVDHLFCAMSDKSKLRAKQAWPMQGGLLEATLYFDELTTEVIADGRHLSPDLLRLALKAKGHERLALCTDCSRALDMPEGEYLFGPLDGGEPFRHEQGVGLMLDGSALASSAQGMDHMVRTFAAATNCPAWMAVAMASITPARIAGVEKLVGSLEAGKLADLLVLDKDLHLQSVYVAGQTYTAHVA